MSTLSKAILLDTLVEKMGHEKFCKVANHFLTAGEIELVKKIAGSADAALGGGPGGLNANGLIMPGHPKGPILQQLQEGAAGAASSVASYLPGLAAAGGGAYLGGDQPVAGAVGGLAGMEGMKALAPMIQQLLEAHLPAGAGSSIAAHPELISGLLQALGAGGGAKGLSMLADKATEDRSKAGAEKCKGCEDPTCGDCKHSKKKYNIEEIKESTLKLAFLNPKEADKLATQINHLLDIAESK